MLTKSAGCRTITFRNCSIQRHLEFPEIWSRTAFHSVCLFQFKVNFLQCSCLAFCMSRSENAESGNLAETPGIRQKHWTSFSISFCWLFLFKSNKKAGVVFQKNHKFLYIIFILRKRSPLLGLGTKMRPFCSDQDDQAFLSSHRPVFFIMSKTKWTLSRYLPSSKPTWLEMDHEWRCISYWTHLIFHCHVSLLEGTNVCANKWKAAVNEGKIFSK